MPSEAALREYYGAAGHEKSVTTARGSVLYDIENDIIVDVKIELFAADERSLAKGPVDARTGMGLDFGGRKPLEIFDSGYASKGQGNTICYAGTRRV